MATPQGSPDNLARFAWDPAWETGNAAIDQQHRQLFQQMERLFSAVTEGRKRSEAERALMLLGEYVETHFLDEESLMRDRAYPRYLEHKAIHDELRKQVQALVTAFIHDLKPFPEVVMDFLVDWLRDHLAGADRAFAAFVRERAN